MITVLFIFSFYVLFKMNCFSKALLKASVSSHNYTNIGFQKLYHIF